MYKITYSGRSLYNPLDPSRDVREPSAELAVNEPGNVKFIVDNDHPEAGRLEMMKGIVELCDGTLPIYRGRIIRLYQGLYLEWNVETEGVLAFFNDSYCKPFNFPEDWENDAAYKTAATSGNVVEFFLKWLIDNHNAQVTDEQKLKLGTVTVTDKNNFITRSSSEYTSTWEALQNKLFNSSLGGYLMPRYEADGTYIDYLQDFTLTNSQSVEFAVNMTDIGCEKDATELFTAVLPVGSEGLTIASLPNSAIGDDIVKEGPLVYSRSAVERYGKIIHVESFDDITEALNLRTRAVEFLSAGGLAQTITVSACDLSFENADVQNFRIGRYTRVKSPAHGIETVMPLLRLSIGDLKDPSSAEITLGKTLTSQADIIKQLQINTNQQFEELQLEFNKQESEIKELGETTTTQVTEALRTAEGIILSALESYTTTNDFETYKEEVSTALVILKDQIGIDIKTKTEEIQETTDDLKVKYEDITKYFRFTDEGLLIGQTGNELLLRLDNDVIEFLREGVPALFITDTGVHADEIHSSEVHIGNFAWVQENDGRLSLRKVT